MADLRYISFMTISESLLMPKLFQVMDASYVYALTIGGVFVLLFVIRSASWLIGSISHRRLTTLKHALFSYIVERHRLFGPWTRSQLLSVLLVLVVNTLSTLIGTSTIEDTGNRAGILSLINLIPCYFGLNLSFAGDMLGISPRSYNRIHALAGLTSSILGLLHTIIKVATTANLSMFRASGQLLSFLALLFLGVQLLQSSKFLRWPSYELFLRSHQALAVAVIYGLWAHTVSGVKFPGLYLIVLAILCSSISILQGCSILFRNLSFRRGRTRALISKSHNAVRVTVTVPRELKVQAGQYINLCIPFLGFRSCLQSHPFTIASWRTRHGSTDLDLIIQPKRGLTLKLFSVSEPHQGSLEQLDGQGPVVPSFGYKNHGHTPQPSDYWTAIVSGPHGTNKAIGDYGRVLMLATGFGIAAQLPYLKTLVQGFHDYRVRTREVLLVWQIERYVDREPAKDLIDRILQHDSRTKGYIFRIVVYYRFRGAAGDPKEDPWNVGSHGRLSYRSGVVELPQLLNEHLESPKARTEKPTVIAISACEKWRDEVKTLLKIRFNTVDLLELDFQPDASCSF